MLSQKNLNAQVPNLLTLTKKRGSEENPTWSVHLVVDTIKLLHLINLEVSESKRIQAARLATELQHALV